MMPDKNKEILKRGNAAITQGDYEGFLSLCSEDTEWIFVGDTVLKGKDAVRQWMKKNYIYPPKVTVADLIAEGDFLIAVGEVTMKDENGIDTTSNYCDIWRFRGELLAELRAFVI